MATENKSLLVQYRIIAFFVGLGAIRSFMDVSEAGSAWPEQLVFAITTLYILIILARMANTIGWNGNPEVRTKKIYYQIAFWLVIANIILLGIFFFVFGGWIDLVQGILWIWALYVISSMASLIEWPN